MYRIDTIQGDGEEAFGRELSPSSPRSTAGPTVIIPFPIPSRVTAALVGLEGEASFPLDEDVFALGELAVRLVTQWNDVRVTCYSWRE